MAASERVFASRDDRGMGFHDALNQILSEADFSRNEIRLAILDLLATGPQKTSILSELRFDTDVGRVIVRALVRSGEIAIIGSMLYLRENRIEGAAVKDVNGTKLAVYPRTWEHFFHFVHERLRIKRDSGGKFVLRTELTAKFRECSSLDRWIARLIEEEKFERCHFGSAVGYRPRT